MANLIILLIFVLLFILAIFYFVINGQRSKRGGAEIYNKTAAAIINYNEQTAYIDKSAIDDKICAIYFYARIYLEYITNADCPFNTADANFNNALNNKYNTDINLDRYSSIKETFESGGEHYDTVQLKIMQTSLQGTILYDEIINKLYSLFLNKLRYYIDRKYPDVLDYIRLLTVLKGKIEDDVSAFLKENSDSLKQMLLKLKRVFSYLQFLKFHNEIKYVYAACNFTNEQVPYAINDTKSDYAIMYSDGYKKFKPLRLNQYDQIDLKLLALLFNPHLVKTYLKYNQSVDDLSVCTLNNFYLQKICRNINRIQRVFNRNDDFKLSPMPAFTEGIINSELINSSYDLECNTGGQLSVFQFLLYVQCREYIQYLSDAWGYQDVRDFVNSLYSDMYTIVDMNRNIKFNIDTKYYLLQSYSLPRNHIFALYSNYINARIAENAPTDALTYKFSKMEDEMFKYELVFKNSNGVVAVFNNNCPLIF